MTKNEILDVLKRQPGVAWFQNTGDGRIICAADHVVTVIQSADPGNKLWRLLTPEQVREVIGQSCTPKLGSDARKKQEIPAPAPAMAADLTDTDFEHADNPNVPKMVKRK